jgi:hypothetical protein
VIAVDAAVMTNYLKATDWVFAITFGTSAGLMLALIVIAIEW